MKRLIKGVFLSTCLLLAASCQNEEVLGGNSAEFEENKTVSEEVLLGRQCGNNAAENGLGSSADEQGTRCSAGNNIANQPGLLDCRAQHRGGHFKDNSDNFYQYSIQQGNKKSNVGTAVRIERTFKKITRPASGTSGNFLVEFDGELKVADLPFNDEGKSNPDFKNDYTYVCQMHGSGKVFDFSAFNGPNAPNPRPKHTTALWLLRAQRTGTSTYNLVLEYGTQPRTDNDDFKDPRRDTVHVANNLNILDVVDIKVRHGYVDRKHGGTIKVNNNSDFNVPSFGFTTEKMFIRYGAYRAGAKMNGANVARAKNSAKIKWRNVTVCNP